MTFSPQVLAERLAAWPAPTRYVALVSGGRDSTVLLHALAGTREALRAPVAVLHFDHGLAIEAREWRERVAAEAHRAGLPFFSESLGLTPGGAVETRARAARYTRLAQWMSPGDCCLSAHHANDQAETFLLQALRGTGPAGLAAMPGLVRFGAGWLGRPLLAWTREELADWASAHGLEWVEDPGNRDLSAPRNWLRHRIWPAIVEHWPAAAKTLARSAELAAQSDALATDIAKEDLARLDSAAGDRLPAAGLRALSRPRRCNVVRWWLRQRGVPLPSARKLAELEQRMVFADPGSRGLLVWPGAEARRYRGMIHVAPPWPVPPARALALRPGEWLDLGGLGRVGLFPHAGGPLRAQTAAAKLQVRFRAGGERIKPAGAQHHRTLKNLLQELEVLPWMRGRLPLLYAGDDLVAVADIVIAAAHQGAGWRLLWEGGPAAR